MDIINKILSCDSIELNELFSILWKNDKNNFIATMFYIRRLTNEQKIKSYNMALWLLKTNEVWFISNYPIFINLGCLKDCLIMSKMADMHYKKIMLLLFPMALALVNDNHAIIKSNIMKSIYPDYKQTLSLSLASKWAPRQGKAYSEFIPYLKKLCNIVGKNSDAAWRKYIRNISAAGNPTIEELLSAKKYNLINFDAIPSKAFTIYKKAFERHLPDRYFAYNTLKNTYNPTDYNILTKYYNSRAHVDFVTEYNWSRYIERNRPSLVNKLFIPVFDIMYKSLSKIMTTGLMLNYSNPPEFRPAITFSTRPVLYNIVGNTAADCINCINDNNYNNELSGASLGGINIVRVFECVLDYYIRSSISAEDAALVNVIILSDLELDPFTLSAGNCDDSNFLFPMFDLYEKNKLPVPKVTYCKITGESSSKIYYYGLVEINTLDCLLKNDFLNKYSEMVVNP